MLDGTERDLPNPTYTCGEDNIKRAVYNMEECIEKRDRTSIQRVLRRKPYEIKN